MRVDPPRGLTFGTWADKPGPQAEPTGPVFTSGFAQLCAGRSALVLQPRPTGTGTTGVGIGTSLVPGGTTTKPKLTSTGTGSKRSGSKKAGPKTQAKPRTPGPAGQVCIRGWRHTRCLNPVHLRVVAVRGIAANLQLPVRVDPPNQGESPGGNVPRPSGCGTRATNAGSARISRENAHLKRLRNVSSADKSDEQPARQQKSRG